MRHFLAKKDEKGMTLVEVLAALVLLGIFFVGFMTLLPQMTLFNEKTGVKLESMNLAKQELAELSYVSDLEKKYVLSNPLPKPINYDIYIKKVSSAISGDYVVEVDFYTKADLDKDLYKKYIENENYSNLNLLYKIHIKIKIDNKVISETFGYLED